MPLEIFSLNFMPIAFFQPMDNNSTSPEETNQMPGQMWKHLLAELGPLCGTLIEMEELRIGGKTRMTRGGGVHFPAKRTEPGMTATTANGDHAGGTTASVLCELRRIVTSIDCNMLKFKRIEPRMMWANTFCKPVHEQKDLFEMSIFGFRHSGDQIPLHDHPKMFGFVVPLYGRFRVSTYTWLDPEEEQNLMFAQKPKAVEAHLAENCGNNNHNRIVVRPARYEGQLLLSAPPENCSVVSARMAMLEPSTANLHMIEALEDGSAFFDLLVPGYHSENRMCTYYNRICGDADGGGEDDEELAIGDIVWLAGSEDTPDHFTMQRI